MQHLNAWKTGLLAAAVCLSLQAQNAPAPQNAPTEVKGLPARTTPADYQVQAKAGALTIAAEFKAHSFPDQQGPLTSEDFVAVEVGIFGAPEARGNVSYGDFSLRINGKKPVPAAQFGLVASSVKDPEWEPPIPAEGKKGKSAASASVGGGGGGNEPPPAPPKPTFAEQRGWSQRARKAMMPEGDRPLPFAGWLFFQYRGQTKGIQTVELLYEGSAGKATLKLQ
jgi:hypothetical protein